MPGRISDDAIRTIRERASLIEVVSDVVALRRRGGRSALGLCPFHAEKTPSFNVSEEHGFYHCFGCDEHGDVFSFVMKTQSLSFPDAVRTVAQRFGLPVPEEASAGGGARAEPLVLVSETAAAFFRGALRGPDRAPATTSLSAASVPTRSSASVSATPRAAATRWRGICARRRCPSTTRSAQDW